MHNIAKLRPAATGATARMGGQYFPASFVMANTEQSNRSVLSWVMAPRKKTLEELNSEAIAKLERRGYNVRGKTPAQIRQMLRARPPKRKSSAIPLEDEIFRRTTTKNPAQGQSATDEKSGARSTPWIGSRAAKILTIGQRPSADKTRASWLLG
jgi:hypothetical protein